MLTILPLPGVGRGGGGWGWFEIYIQLIVSYYLHTLLSVLHDIISTMFHKRFMEELFKPQPLYSKKAMRTVFDRLAHASIMRLNAPSMDKVY